MSTSNAFGKLPADVARDLVDGLEMLQGRRLPWNPLSPGALELLAWAHESIRISGDQSSARRPGVPDDAGVPFLMPLSEVAEVLSMSLPTVKRLVARGELTAVKLGGSTRVRPVDLVRYIDELPLVAGRS